MRTWSTPGTSSFGNTRVYGKKQKVLSLEKCDSKEPELGECVVRITDDLEKNWKGLWRTALLAKNYQREDQRLAMKGVGFGHYV